MNLITSIPERVSRPLPSGADVGQMWTEQCIWRWVMAGFKVHSLNNEAEIEALKDRYPHVTFHTAKRDARAEVGKPLVYLRDMLDTVAAQPGEYVAITNADVFLRIDDFQKLMQCRPEGMAYSTRIDVDDLDMTNAEIHGGVDFLFFHRDILEKLDLPDFIFGTPWWDYWLPIATLGMNLPITRLESNGVPIIAHLRHAERWNEEQFARNYHLFMRYLAQLPDLPIPAMAEIAKSFSGLIKNISIVNDIE